MRRYVLLVLVSSIFLWSCVPATPMVIEREVIRQVPVEKPVLVEVTPEMPRTPGISGSINVAFPPGRVYRFIDHESSVVCWVIYDGSTYYEGMGAGMSCLPLKDTRLD